MNEEMKIKEGCEGCSVKKLCDIDYVEDKFRDDKLFINCMRNCPCKICLIKMICFNICEEFTDVWPEEYQ